MINLKKNNTKKIIITLLFSCFVLNSISAVSKSVLNTYNHAVDLENNEDWYEACQYYIEVVNENPAFTDAWFRLADCSYRLGEFDLALQYLLQAEKYEKNNSRIQNLKGMINLALGDIEAARTIFNEVLRKYPNDIDSHFGLAEIELFDGKFSGAELQYAEALKRQSDNRKALLSLVLVCAEIGRYDQAEEYLRQAMQFYSGESKVHYLAAIVYLRKGDYAKAEQHARISVEIDGNFEKGYELISSLLYLQNRYSEVIDVTDFLISRNRNNSTAWYLRGIAQSKLGKTKEAISTWSTGLNINPQDEVMRWQLELAVRQNLNFNDERRAEWSNFHVQNAQQFASRYDKSGATYEYQRALLLDPKNKTARLSYADMLEMDGMHELYLSQLEFVKNNTTDKLSTTLEDTIEAYSSLLVDTLAKKWKVDPFYLDKTRWNIAIFYEENGKSLYHVDSDKLTALACSDVFSGIAITSVKTQVNPITGFGEAFKNARKNNFDYFIIVKLNEGEDDVSLNAKMYSGRTGSEAFDLNFYSTGNNRFSTVLRRFRSAVLDTLTVRGKILQRNGKVVLVDLGKSENIKVDDEFKIIKKGQVKTADSGIGLYYRDADVIGTLKISKAGEEVSEALITEHGFYDKINANDEIVLINVSDTEKDSVIDTVPNSDAKGKKIVLNNVKAIDEIKKAIEKPAILELLRNIK